MKALFDTNVICAAFITEGLCARLMLRAGKRQFELFTCPQVIKEAERVLSKKIGASPVEIREVITLLERVSTAPGPEMNPVDAGGACRDSDDDQIIGWALALGVDFIVTGDQDLLTIKTHKGVRIVSPRDFELLFGSLDV